MIGQSIRVCKCCGSYANVYRYMGAWPSWIGLFVLCHNGGEVQPNYCIFFLAKSAVIGNFCL